MSRGNVLKTLWEEPDESAASISIDLDDIQIQVSDFDVRLSDLYPYLDRHEFTAHAHLNQIVQEARAVAEWIRRIVMRPQAGEEFIISPYAKQILSKLWAISKSIVSKTLNLPTTSSMTEQ